MIGTLTLVSTTPAGNAFSPITLMPRVKTLQGTGTIGTARITYYDLDPGRGAAPDSVGIGPDGAAWFTRGHDVVRITADDSLSDLLLPPTGFAGSVSTVGGALWLTAWSGTPGLIRLDAGTGQGKLFSAPSPLRRPTMIAADGQGGLLFTGGDLPSVGALRAGSDQVVLVASENADPPVTIATSGLTVTASGDIFVADYQGGRIGRVQDKHFSWIDIGGPSIGPSGLTVGADGAIWFVNLGFGPEAVGRVAPDLNVSYFPLPAELQGDPNYKSGSSMVRASDGTMWFTLPEANALGRVTAAGQIDYIRLDEDSLPRGLAIDAQGRLWFTTYGAARIDLNP